MSREFVLGVFTLIVGSAILIFAYMAGAAAHLRRPEGKVSLAAAILSVVLATVLLPWAMPHLYAK